MYVEAEFTEVTHLVVTSLSLSCTKPMLVEMKLECSGEETILLC